MQPGGWHYEDDNWGWRSPYRVEREMVRLLVVVMVMGVGELLLNCYEVWVSVYMDGSEQSNNDGLKLKLSATTPLFIIVYWGEASSMAVIWVDIPIMSKAKSRGVLIADKFFIIWLIN